MQHFFHNIGRNFVAIFSGKNPGLIVLAALLTALCVYSGFDWDYSVLARSLDLRAALFPAVSFGTFLPFVAPIFLLAAGMASKNGKTLATGFAVGQAAFLGWVISSFFKALTGRVHPPRAGDLIDTSAVFQFGWWRGGIFWGWPSSHVTVSVAMAAAVFALYPQNRLVRGLAIAYGAYLFISISATIHWFSDALAGVLFGTAIGLAVGKGFIALKLPSTSRPPH